MSNIITGCGNLDIYNPCGLNLHQELFGSLPKKNYLPSDKGLTNMLEFAFKKANQGPEAVESSFRTSLKTYFQSKNQIDQYNLIPIDKIKSVFHSTYNKIPNNPITPEIKEIPSINQIPSDIPIVATAANSEATASLSTKVFTALSAGSSTIKAAINTATSKIATHANIAGQILMKKEVLIPIAITVGVIAIGIVAYKIFSKPTETIEPVKDKKPLQFINPHTPIHPNTAARIASIFEKT